MGDILSLAKKLERAMRNGTGFNVTQDEVTAMVAHDIVDAVYNEKLKALKAQCPVKPATTPSVITGSTSGGTASPPRSGKSPPMTGDAAKSYIGALGFGM